MQQNDFINEMTEVRCILLLLQPAANSSTKRHAPRTTEIPLCLQTHDYAESDAPKGPQIDPHEAKTSLVNPNPFSQHNNIPLSFLIQSPNFHRAVALAHSALIAFTADFASVTGLQRCSHRAQGGHIRSDRYHTIFASFNRA